MTPEQYSRPLKMNVLVACEYSGRVRDAFRARGHEAWSCDMLDPEIPESGLGHIYHLKGDVMRVLGGSIPRDMVQDSAWRDTPLVRRWDLIIAHPPCTYLTIAAEWAYRDVQTKKMKPGTLIGAERRQAREEALAFFRALWEADCPRICIENPVGVVSTRITPPPPNNPTISIRRGCQQGNLPMVEGVAAASANQAGGTTHHCRWAQALGQSNRFRPKQTGPFKRPMERPQPHLSGYSGCNG